MKPLSLPWALNTLRLKRHVSDCLYLRVSIFNPRPTSRHCFFRTRGIMASLKLHIDETNPLVREVYGNYSDWKLFCILRRYLEPRKRHLSLKDASILIYKILMPVAPGSSIQYPVKAFGSVVLNVAGQIPYSHASQDRLVRLLDQFHQFIELELTDEHEVGRLLLAAESLWIRVTNTLWFCSRRKYYSWFWIN